MSTLAATHTTGKQKAANGIRVLERHTLSGQPLSISINHDGDYAEYNVLHIENIEDGILWRIRKMFGKRDVGKIYDTFIAVESSTCDCPGHTYKNKCKHIPALTALTISEGQRQRSRPACHPIANHLKPVALEPGDVHCRDCNGTGWKHVTLDAKKSVFRCVKCDGLGLDLPF